ncbi:MAG: TetR/AcrR family transcriptional regulator [Firmicutes bacterium]|nr:TetR/AcrR family transcriptional regulator [Bacillota bacterium]
MQTTQSQPGDKRGPILDAAQRVFADRGFHNATVDLIADHAGVAKGTIYLYFKSKHELLAALIEDRVSRLINLIRRSAEEGPSALERLRAIVRVHFVFYENNQEFMALLYGQLGHMATELEERVTRVTEELTAIIESSFACGIDEGVFRPGDTRLLTFGLQGMIHAVAFEWIMAGSVVPPDGVAEDVYRLFVEGAAVRDGQGEGQDRR